jgi:hypothetical protein
VLDQVGVRAFDDRADYLAKPPVVDRVREVVAPAGLAKVEVKVHVDLEGLGPFTLFWKSPVRAEAAQATQLHPVAVGSGYLS